ncbi:hypothetical protein SDC9_141433 [bioreactor metagenome]|uniref:Uncharacterized protein n=1 Tax=bioreactor metagenome TaxID=1076179 RepID=A0A645DY28_9ZZZZ
MKIPRNVHHFTLIARKTGELCHFFRSFCNPGRVCRSKRISVVDDAGENFRQVHNFVQIQLIGVKHRDVRQNVKQWFIYCVKPNVFAHTELQKCVHQIRHKNRIPLPIDFYPDTFNLVNHILIFINQNRHAVRKVENMAQVRHFAALKCFSRAEIPRDMMVPNNFGSTKERFKSFNQPRSSKRMVIC